MCVYLDIQRMHLGVSFNKGYMCSHLIFVYGQNRIQGSLLGMYLAANSRKLPATVGLTDKACLLQ